MDIVGFNESNSEKYFLFYVKEKSDLFTYYRISIDDLRSILSLNEMSSQDIEESKEFKDMDKVILINRSDLYAKYLGNHKWIYYLHQFVVPYVVFDGYANFPPHVFKSGIGFTSGFGNAFDKGIRAFLGDGDDKLALEELSFSKNSLTSIRKVPNKGYKINIMDSDFEKLFDAVGTGRQIGTWMSQDAVSEFLHKSFPEKSKYSLKDRSNDMKKLFLSSMNTTIIDKFSKDDLRKVEDFYEALIGKKGNKDNFLQRNFLKVSECNLESILDEFKKNLDKNPKEQIWQTFFEKNIFIFDSRYINFISKHCIKTGRSSEPDFLVYDIYGYIDIYEIKKSDVSLLQFDSSHDNYYWSAEVSKALAQLEKYIFTCTQNRLSIEQTLKDEKGLVLKIIRPKGVLVIGSRKNLADEKMEKDFEILRSTLKNIEIVLYDEMYNRLKNLKISSLKISDKKND